MLFIWLFLYGAVMLLAKAAAPMFSFAPTVALVLYTTALVIWIMAAGKAPALGFQKVSLTAFRKHLFFIPYLTPVFYNIFRFGFLFPAGRQLPGIVCAVILEEILFRGFLTQWLCRRSLFWGVILSGLAFGIAHMVNLESGMLPTAVVCQMLFALCVGIALSGLRLSARSIYPGIGVHLLINLTAGSGENVAKDPLFWISMAMCLFCGIRSVSLLRKESSYEIIH